MALIRVGPKFRDRGNITLPNTGTFLTEYFGTSNNRLDVANSICRSSMLPQLGQRDFYVGDPRAIVTNIEAIRVENSFFHWDIFVESSTDAPTDDDNPLNRAAKFSIASEQYQIQAVKDARGEWIRNRAGTVIPIPKDSSFWIINVEKNVRSIPAPVFDMNNKVNSGTVFLAGLTIPRHKLMVKGILGDQQEWRTPAGQRITYVAMFFQLHYRREGWKVKYPNVDLMQLVDAPYPVYESRRGLRARGINEADARPIRTNDGNILYEVRTKIRVPIVDDTTGERITEPWYLDRDGRALPNLNGVPQGQIIELETDIYEQTSFDLLPLR